MNNKKLLNIYTYSRKRKPYNISQHVSGVTSSLNTFFGGPPCTLARACTYRTIRNDAGQRRRRACIIMC